MGNSEISFNEEDNNKLVFEENKKEYFLNVRKNLKENFNEIITTLNSSSKSINNNTLNNNDFSEDHNIWQSFLVSRLKTYYKSRHIQSVYIENVIDYVEKLTDSNDNHIYNLKLLLSQEIDETKNKVFSEYQKEKNTLFSPAKNTLIFRSVDFIYYNLEKHDHPLNKVIRILNFNLSLKYTKELLELEKSWDEILDNLTKRRRYTEKGGRKLSSLSFDNNKSVIDCEAKVMNRDEEYDKFYQYCKEEISGFSMILIFTVIKFYNITDKTDFKIIDIFGEKIKDLLVSGELLSFLQKLKFSSKNQIIAKYQQKFLEYYNILPIDLSISPYFSFDLDFKDRISEKTVKINEEIVSFSNLPFTKSLKYFRKIKKVQSILDKIDIVYNLRDIVLSEIDLFWKGYEFPKEKRFLDADNLLSIFIYLVVKSQLYDLIIEIEIIHDFISKSLKLSRKGKKIKF